jgi:hypothetical protein
MANDTSDPHIRVEVYWNLYKKCWSVRRAGGRVLYHARAVTLDDVTWVVQPGGRARVLREGKKNVHAFARGTLTRVMPIGAEPSLSPLEGHIYRPRARSRAWQAVSYNPFRLGMFIATDLDGRVQALGAMNTPLPPGFVPEPPEPEPEPPEPEHEDPDLARMGRVLASTEEALDRATSTIAAMYWLAKLGQLEPPGTPAFDLSVRMQRAVTHAAGGDGVQPRRRPRRRCR